MKAHDEAVSGMELKYILVSGGDGFLTRTFTDEQAPEVFEKIFGTDGDGIVPYLAEFLNRKSEEWNVHYWNQHPEIWSVNLEDGWVSVYVLDDTHVDLTIPAKPAPEPLIGSGEPTSARLSIGDLEKILNADADTPIQILPNGEIVAADGSQVKPLTMRENLGGEYGGGASDGDMGDEQWVYEYTGDHLAVSVPSKHDPLWSVAWSNGERIGEGASQPLMWADARRRLTSEAAAVTAPDLKAQDKTPTAAECDAFVQRSLGNAYWNKDRVTVDELAIARYAIEQIRKQSDLASLAKKLAAALVKIEADSIDHVAVRIARDVLTEAKKAGCA